MSNNLCKFVIKTTGIEEQQLFTIPDNKRKASLLMGHIEEENGKLFVVIYKHAFLAYLKEVEK